MSKSDPMTSKEILSVVGITVSGLVVAILVFVWSRNAEANDLLRAALGGVIGLAFWTLGLAYGVRQDSKRDVRKHVREFHQRDGSSDPQA